MGVDGVEQLLESHSIGGCIKPNTMINGPTKVDKEKKTMENVEEVKDEEEVKEEKNEKKEWMEKKQMEGEQKEKKRCLNCGGNPVIGRCRQ
ncbi:hypothetical protein LSTR_LSTR011241 [Laodelphax striatellus]|uniref:Uncharacterized protein n=1 Tax=Laodelphax striatellus TaxID=195883 RepID=A0A482XQ96_LAOST|nr:hypothetical protein LSTR_LSTR011241 [Laodelphax striatellus]